MRKLLFILSFLPALLNCTDKSVTIYPDAVVLISETSGAVRLTVINEDIFKIEASPTSEFDPEASLIETGKYESVPFNVEEKDDFVVISTDNLTAHISKEDGRLSFFKANGERIISEKADHGRTFTPVTVDGLSEYSLRQQFDSPEDEGLYGLGQHQADEMNYKGKNEELFQYNTKVSVPFIVSTENYGILWDNYSLSRFGDDRPYSNLDQFVLFDKEGKEGGLTATYVDDRNSGNIFVDRRETSIDYENLETISGFPRGFDFTHSIITWEGSLQSRESGIFRFLCYYAGYTKLWIDGELKFEKWRTAWNPSVAKFQLDMKEGEKHQLRLEWIPDGGVSYIGLKALSPVEPEEQNRISFFSEMGSDIRYYFMTGNSMDEVISHYRTLTGKAQVMPKWSMGFWQSRERYKTQDELLGVLKEFRRRHIPIDNIVQDWSYWPEDQWGSHDFDVTRFPDPDGMVRQVHDEHARIMISVWPKFYINTDNFKAFDEHGWMYRQAVEDSIRDWIGSGYIGSFYDAYNPQARALFWDQIHVKLYTKGFDAWWLDATEPDILSNASIDYRKKLMNPTALGPSTKYFNAYALQNAKGIYEGQRSVNPQERVFILTRSAFAGIQRYGAVTWSGDIGTRWEDMKSQISAGINFALSGLPYWTMDIGGFCVEKRYEQATEGSEDLAEWRELNTRWFQFGSFIPLFRVHGQYPYREVFNLAPVSHPAYKSMVYYNKLRYRLMPYIYSLAGWAWLKDYTIMRGLAMDFTADRAIFNTGDQFMFGPSIMVCPVYTYKARSREVYLPESAGWYDLYSGEYLTGGRRIMAKAPYERMPLYVKAGSLIPFGPEIEYTGQKPSDPLTLMVYTGKDFTFDLYEDDGTSYAYEEGEYSITPISWSEADQKLTIGERDGGFDGMINEMDFRILFVTPDHPVGAGDWPASIETVRYDGHELVVSNGR